MVGGTRAAKFEGSEGERGDDRVVDRGLYGDMIV